MNFLAHAYLSFGNDEVLVGNMISDFVKGKKQFDYTPAIQAGIRLHREIDNFTDTHPATAKAKRVFQKEYRLYSGAFIDVVYDYFLANDKNEFARNGLASFAQQTYTTLDRYYEVLPAHFQKMLFYMKEQNWLYNYREPRGIYKSFGGLVHRAKYMNDSKPAEQLFESHIELLGEQYRLFWKDLKSFAEQQYNLLVNSKV